MLYFHKYSPHQNVVFPPPSVVRVSCGVCVARGHEWVSGSASCLQGFSELQKLHRVFLCFRLRFSIWWWRWRLLGWRDPTPCRSCSWGCRWVTGEGGANTLSQVTGINLAKDIDMAVIELIKKDVSY